MNAFDIQAGRMHETADDFIELVVRHLEGRLTPEEAVQLNTRLAEDAASRDHFVALCTQACLLASHVEIGAEEAFDLKMPEASSPAVPSSILGGAWQGTVDYFSQVGPLSYLVATVLLALILLAGSWITIHRPVSSDYFVKSATGSASAIGRVTALAECKWSVVSGQWPEITNHKSKIINHKFYLGDRFTLSSGLMEITYDTGAKVILEGPCTYEIDSDRGGFLAVGKLTARIVATDHRPLTTALFAVRTPTAVVTDLGTEFGVEVEQSGSTRSHVFQGRVEVRRSRGPGSSSLEEAVELGTGEWVHVKRKRNGAIVIQRETGSFGHFVRTMPSDAESPNSHQRMGERIVPPGVGRLEKPAMSPRAYAQYVLSLNPIVYYQMEQPATVKHRHVVFDSASGGYHGAFRTKGLPVLPYAAGRFGDAMVFRGADAGDCVVLPDCPITKAGPMTVSAWVMADARPDWATIIANWGVYKNGESLVAPIHLALMPRHSALSATVQTRDDRREFVEEGVSPGDAPFPIRCWQHVALVVDAERDGTTLRLYRNGKEVESHPSRGVMPSSPDAIWVVGGAAVRIGNTTHSWDTRSPLFGWQDNAPMALRNPATQLYWQGRIDEVALFNEALSPKTIERLYFGGTVGEKGDDAMNDP